MPAERRESEKSQPPPLAQASSLCDGALAKLQSLRRDIEANISTLVAISDLLSDPSMREVGQQRSRTTDAAIERSRAALETLQSVDVNSTVEPIARQVARVLAILYAFKKAEAAKPRRRPKAPKQVPKDIINRRAAPRAVINAEIGFQSDTNFYTGFSEDISTGGIFLSTFDIRPMGSSLNVNFTLPGGHFISVDGEVRWVREYNELSPDVSPGMGVQFKNLSADDRDAIDAFIQQRSTLFFDDNMNE